MSVVGRVMDEGEEQKSVQPKSGSMHVPVPGHTQVFCRELRDQLSETGEELRRVCRSADPSFVQAGRDLQDVARESRGLTEAIRQAAELLGGEGGKENPLAKSDAMVRHVLERLQQDRQEIDHDLQQIRDLILQISDCRRINDTIDRISASFRAVRINIRIQCSSQLLSDDIFKDVTEDIDVLSKALTRITKEIKSDLSAAAKKLMTLERTVSSSLIASERISISARGVVTRTNGDLRQLMLGTRNMIREAGKRSATIAGMIDEVVVNIQFHDSLSQRASHILHAFSDIGQFCSSEKGPPAADALGSAHLILDLQHRQLSHIVDEISSIYQNISRAVAVIGTEVKGLNSILMDNQFRAVGPQQFLSSLSASLADGLQKLCHLVDEGATMIDQINSSADETRQVASRLVEIMADVSEMRDETRLQAVNTIIMAGNLGEKGRTIQVLAKEISSLSDQTSELVSDVEVMQLAVNHKVEKLCGNWVKGEDVAESGSLSEQIVGINDSFRYVEKVIASLSGQIDTTCGHIETVYSELTFIHRLQEGLKHVVARVEQIKDSLQPWQGMAGSDSPEIRQLIERYTMEQERLIHLFDRVDEKNGSQGEDDIFF